MDQYMSHRSWMYDRKYPGGRTIKARFKDGVEEFVTYAMSQDIVKSEGGIRCPCIKCMCGAIQSPEDVIVHLEKVGFMNDYYVWRHHGEREPANINTEFDVNRDASSSGAREGCGNFGRMQEMVDDALGVNMSYEGGVEEEIIPNDKAMKFYAMMEEVNKPLFEGASDSKLSMCVRLLAARSNWNVPEDCLEFFSKMMLDATPVKDNLPTSYYDAKRLVSKLGLKVEKIDCCVQGCMLFYDNEFGTNDGSLEECKFCNAPRYQARNGDVHRQQKKIAVKSMFYLPIIPRLQRLFASMRTASQMTWHYNNKTNSNVMRHPCDGLAWKHFDAMHPDMAWKHFDAKHFWVHDPPENPYRPNWIGEEVWQKLLHYWENDETFKKRSQANKGNRNLGKGGCLHTQGSVGVFSHAQQLIKEKGPNVDVSDIHKETHIRKSTGSYVDTRSETTQRLYDDEIGKFLDKHPEYSSHDEIPRTIRRDIWQEVSGPGTKNTKYGFGKLALNIRHENLVHIPTPEEMCRPVALPAAAQAVIERLTRELQATKEELIRRDQQDQERHQMMQQEIRGLREDQTRALDQQRREVGAYVRELLASSSRNAPIGETNPQEDSTNSNNEDMSAN